MRAGIVKRIFIFTVIIVLFTFSAAGAAATVKVYVNEAQIISDTPAVIVNNYTMLPFRVILNSLGISDSQIIYDDISKSIEIKYERNFIFLSVGQNAAIVNDSIIFLDTLPYIENGRTMVPVRFISESLGADVRWDEANKIVYITK